MGWLENGVGYVRGPIGWRLSLMSIKEIFDIYMYTVGVVVISWCWLIIWLYCARALYRNWLGFVVDRVTLNIRKDRLKTPWLRYMLLLALTYDTRKVSGTILSTESGMKVETLRWSRMRVISLAVM